MYEITAVNLMCPQIAIGVEHLAAVPAVVEEGVVHMLGLYMVKDVSLKFGHLPTENTLPFLNCPVHHHGHVHQEHVGPVLGGGVVNGCPWEIEHQRQFRNILHT